MTALVQPPEGFGTPIKGPSALAGDPQRFWTLAWTLAITEFKLRFFGSVLGYFWQLMRPLMLFGVLYVVFTQVLTVSEEPLFPASLLMGIVLFTFFAEATAGAVGCVVERENLVRRIHFPRLAIPVAVVLTATFNLVLNLLIVFAFGLAIGIQPRWEWLELIPLLFVLLVYAVGLAALLSALFVRFRDIRPIWDVILQVMFYASMILVPFEYVQQKYDDLARILLLNPLAAIIQQLRFAVVEPQAHSAADAMGRTVYLFGPATVMIGLTLLGLWVFSREAPRVAEDL